MKYEILGPLRLVDGDRIATIGARKMEVLLAALLVRPDQVVAVDQLQREIWGSSTPRRAGAGLQVYVSRLRRFLADFSSAANPIITRPPGYLLQLGQNEIDYRDFSRLLHRGRVEAREGRQEAAVASFTEALGLWRGAALEGIPHGPVVEGLIAWLTEARLECVERLIESRLALGHHRELVSELYALTADHPLREPFHRQLMLALYRSRRQADALRGYQSVRTALTEELGLEPSPELRELHHAILRDDPDLEVRTTPRLASHSS